jgi:hypothetical protein
MDLADTTVVLPMQRILTDFVVLTASAPSMVVPISNKMVLPAHDTIRQEWKIH